MNYMKLKGYTCTLYHNTESHIWLWDSHSKFRKTTHSTQEPNIKEWTLCRVSHITALVSWDEHILINVVDLFQACRKLSTSFLMFVSSAPCCLQNSDMWMSLASSLVYLLWNLSLRRVLSWSMSGRCLTVTNFSHCSTTLFRHGSL